MRRITGGFVRITLSGIRNLIEVGKNEIKNK